MKAKGEDPKDIQKDEKKLGASKVLLLGFGQLDEIDRRLLLSFGRCTGEGPVRFFRVGGWDGTTLLSPLSSEARWLFAGGRHDGKRERQRFVGFKLVESYMF